MTNTPTPITDAQLAALKSAIEANKEPWRVAIGDVSVTPQTIASLITRLELAEGIVRLYVDPGNVRSAHAAVVNTIQGNPS